jgi:hypothetical protein
MSLSVKPLNLKHLERCYASVQSEERKALVTGDREDLVRQIIVAIVASILLTSCIAGSESRARPPNYVTSQVSQSPAWRNDTFGGAALPQRGLPH